MALDSVIALLGGILGGGSAVWLWQNNKLNLLQERLDQARRAQRQAESITAQHTQELADLERSYQQQIKDLQSQHQEQVLGLTQIMKSNEDNQLFPFDDFLGEKQIDNDIPFDFSSFFDTDS